MNLKKLLVFLIIIYFIPCIFGYKTQTKKNDLIKKLPSSVDGWFLRSKPDVYVGENLFFYINGGAEIYHEYGFKKVVKAIYKNNKKETINAEIYEMKDSNAAFGIYSLKTSSSGKNINFKGSQGKLEDYYLNLWKGKYKITIVGFNEKKETIDGVLNIGKNIVKKLSSKKTPPPKLVEHFESLSTLPKHIKYMKGEIALFNVHKFSEKKIFNINKGATGYFDKYKIFIFKYKDKKNQQNIFNRSKIYYRNKKQFKEEENSYCLIDDNNNYLFVKSSGSYIFIYIGSTGINAKNILNKIEEKIKDENR